MQTGTFRFQGIGDKYRNDPSNWENDLFKKLEKLLVSDSGTIPSTLWEKIVSTPETRRMWIDCFTHYSVDFHNNYEVPETFGDVLLSSGLYYMMLGNPEDPNFSNILKSANLSDVMSKINTNATSKIFLTRMFYEKFEGLHEYIRCSKEFGVVADIMEDVFEALISTIQMSVDRVSWEGQYLGPGFVSVIRFVHWFYLRKLSSDELDLSGKANTKTFVKEYLEKNFAFTTGDTRVATDERSGFKYLTVTLKSQNRQSVNPFGNNTGFYIDSPANKMMVVNAGNSFVIEYRPESQYVTIKGYEIPVYERLLQYFKSSREYSKSVKEFEDYNQRGLTSFVILKSVVGSQEDYENLKVIARRMNIRPETMDFKRKVFKTDDVSIVIWGKDRDTDEKKMIMSLFFKKDQGAQSTYEAVHNWIVSNL